MAPHQSKNLKTKIMATDGQHLPTHQVIDGILQHSLTLDQANPAIKKQWRSGARVK